MHIPRLYALAPALAMWHLAFAADPVTFDYSTQSAVAQLPYSKNLAVTLTNVNVLDYKYVVGEIKVGLPGPQIDSAAHPKPATTNAWTVAAKDVQPKSTAECLKEVEKRLPERLSKFGDKVAAWNAQLSTDLKALGCPLEFLDALTEAFGGIGDVKHPGTKLLDSPDINRKAAETAPGGWIEVPITATGYASKITSLGDDTVIKLRIEQIPLPAPIDTAGAAHVAVHVLRIQFDVPQGIVSSLGPFVSGLHQKRWNRVANPDDASKFVVGLAEDSAISYGVAAYWNVDAINISAHADWLSFCWGIAYTPQNQVEQSIAGLLGIGWHVKKTPLFLQLGAAIGSGQDLSGGLTVGKPIGANQEITTTSHLKAAFFLGMSFVVAGAPR